jgi:hypothetical protein
MRTIVVRGGWSHYTGTSEPVDGGVGTLQLWIIRTILSVKMDSLILLWPEWGSNPIPSDPLIDCATGSGNLYYSPQITAYCILLLRYSYTCITHLTVILSVRDCVLKKEPLWWKSLPWRKTTLWLIYSLQQVMYHFLYVWILLYATDTKTYQGQ